MREVYIAKTSVRLVDKLLLFFSKNTKEENLNIGAECSS